MPVPVPLPTPANAPHARSPIVGEPPTGTATMPTPIAAAVWATTATDQALARRDTKPPTKSERPYAIDAASAKTTVTAVHSVAAFPRSRPLPEGRDRHEHACPFVVLHDG